MHPFLCKWGFTERVQVCRLGLTVWVRVVRK
nr:MAG TPA: hypothetical protein [Herelleviridae sp.]